MRIENNTFTMPAQQAEKASAQPLQTGDSVKAEVLFVSGGKANIKLDNGAVLKGVQLEGVDLKQGDILTLTVSDAQDNQLTLKVTDNAGQASQAAQGGTAEMLKEMGVEPNARNIMVANLLIKNGMEVSPQTLENATALLETFPKLTEEQAVFLANSGIADAELVEAFVRLVDENALTGSQLQDLTRLLTEAANGPEAQAQGGAAEATLSQAQAQAAPEAALPAQAGQTQVQTLQAQGQDQIQGAPALAEQARQAMDEVARVSPEAAKLFADSGVENEAAAAALKMAAQPQNSEHIAREFVETNLAALPPEAKEAAALSLERAASFIAVSEAPAASEDAAVKVERLLEDIDRLFARVLPDGKGGEQLQKAAARMQEKLMDLRAQIESGNMPGKEALLQKLDQTISQTKLMSEIQQYAFVQIPVTLEDRKSTAELYVMKRDKGKKPIDPEDVTMIIALDTQHMGRVESVIKVDKKAVSLHAKVEGDNVAEHIKSGSVKLHALLKDIGYKLVDLNARKQDLKVNPLNAEKKAEVEYSRPLSLDYKI